MNPRFVEDDIDDEDTPPFGGVEDYFTTWWINRDMMPDMFATHGDSFRILRDAVNHLESLWSDDVVDLIKRAEEIMAAAQDKTKIDASTGKTLGELETEIKEIIETDLRPFVAVIED